MMAAASTALAFLAARASRSASETSLNIADASAATTRPVLVIDVIVSGLPPSGIGEGTLGVRLTNITDHAARDVKVEVARLDGAISISHEIESLPPGESADIGIGPGTAQDMMSPQNAIKLITARYSDAYGFGRYELTFAAEDWRPVLRQIR